LAELNDNKEFGIFLWTTWGSIIQRLLKRHTKIST
jgi:hypothetical protein